MLKKEFKEATLEYSKREILKFQDNNQYPDLVLQKWNELIQNLINNSSVL